MIKIYKITCLIDNKVYIGQTSESLNQRFSRHMGYQKDNYNTKFYRAIREFGRDAFIIEEIEDTENQEVANEKELYWINKFDSVNNGYNTKGTIGKCGGDTMTGNPNIKAISKKLSEGKMGDKNPMRIYGGLRGDKNGMYGVHGKDHPNHKECVAINIISGDVFYFESLTDAGKTLSTSISCISQRCKENSEKPLKGHIYKYKEDYNEGQTTIENINK